MKNSALKNQEAWQLTGEKILYPETKLKHRKSIFKCIFIEKDHYRKTNKRMK